METAPTKTVSQLLRAWGDGDLQAREDLIPLVHQELRTRAAAYLRRERRDHTLQPTALVNEAYIRLIGQQRVTWVNRAQFFGVASQMMRRILVDHARERQAAKRAGGIRVTLDDGMRSSPPVDCEVLLLDEALRELAGARRAAGAHRGAEVLRRALRGRDGRGAVAVAGHDHPRVAVGAGVAVSPRDPRAIRAAMTDDRQRWAQVKAIFDTALAWAPEERAARLREACGEDEALRDDVASLLAAHAEAGSFAEGAAIDGSIAGSGAAALVEGVELGPYRILGPLDAGGMGEVYRALDTRLHREVAIKVLPAAPSRPIPSASRGWSVKRACSPR